MAIIDLYESSEHRNNIAHFASIVNLAISDGSLNEHETQIIKTFAKKLSITDSEYEEVLKNPSKYPVIPQSDSEKRLERIYDLFRIIYSDHEMDEIEKHLILRYAIMLGCTNERAEQLIKKSIKIFSGTFDFETYKSFLDIVDS